MYCFPVTMAVCRVRLQLTFGSLESPPGTCQHSCAGNCGATAAGARTRVSLMCSPAQPAGSSRDPRSPSPCPLPGFVTVQSADREPGTLLHSPFSPTWRRRTCQRESAKVNPRGSSTATASAQLPSSVPSWASRSSTPPFSPAAGRPQIHSSANERVWVLDLPAWAHARGRRRTWGRTRGDPQDG
jgi:hypothetical protein